MSEVAEAKKPWKSKTNWVALVMAVLSFFPSIGSWVSQNPEIFMQITAGLIAILRWATKGKVSIT